MNIEQKIITVSYAAGVYYNFFFAAGSINSLAKFNADGWIVKDVVQNGKGRTIIATIILQRESK